MHDQSMLTAVNHDIMSMQSQIIKNNILMRQISDQKLSFHCRFFRNIHVQNDLADDVFNMFAVEVFNIVNDFSESDKQIMFVHERSINKCRNISSDINKNLSLNRFIMNYHTLQTEVIETLCDITEVLNI